MKRALTMVVACLLVATACAEDGAAPRRLSVDFSYDQFASYFIRFFPSSLSVHPGTELVFDQTWTGEPHSVTGGTLVDRLMETVRPIRERFLEGEAIPDEPPKEVVDLEADLVTAYTETGGLNQTAAQPCYVTSGKPRQDGKPCTVRKQPVFTGNQSYYNSGVIPYEGPQGNEFTVKLGNDIEPGSYWFYCNVHGALQSTEVIVKPSDEQVDSPDEVARRARREVNQMASRLLPHYRNATSKGRIRVTPPGSRKEIVVEGNFSGISEPGHLDAAINEFIPRKISARRGQKIIWNVMGGHTISFGVPEYFPIISFNEDGTVERNEKLDPPSGGARRLDPSSGETSFDGGSYDGKGFWSSGIVFGEPVLKYSMRITEKGTYRYACLIHPPMVGTVEVR